MVDPGRPRLARFLAELRRRRVFRVSAAYLVIAWIIIQVASDVFPALQLPDWTTTLVVVLALLGFPVAVALAWAYDVTPEGVERTAPADAGSPGATGREAVVSGDAPGPGADVPTPRWRSTARVPLMGALVALALGGGTFLVSHLGTRPPARAASAATGDAAHTVAVLPFQVRGSERLAYLGEGMVDLLSTDLARDGALEAVDPNALLSVVAARPDRPLDPDGARALAADFEAGFYVLGSVFEVEGRVRLTASVYDRSRGSRPVATRTVEGSVADVLSLVARLAAELGGALPSGVGDARVSLVWSGDSVDVLGSPSPDGRLLSFTDWFTGDLAVRDLASAASRRITNKGEWTESDEFAELSRFSPDGRRIAYAWFDSSFTYQLRVVGVDGSEPRVLLQGSDSAWMAPNGWKPDGSAVLLTWWEGRNLGRLVWVSVMDGKVEPLRTIGHGWDPFLLSPDGRWIAWDRPAEDDPRQGDIHVMAVDGSGERVVVRSPADDVLLAWTPDGRHLLFWSDRGSAPAIWRVPVANGRAGGEPTLVRSDMWWVHPLGFGGEDFLYAITASERQVHAITVDVEAATVLEPAAPAAHGAAQASRAPAWSPDGARLAYVSERPGAQPLAAQLAVREVATGAVTEYPIGLRNGRVTQWLGADAVLLSGWSPVEGSGWYALDLGTGARTWYEIGPGVSRSLVVTGDGRTQYFFRWVGPGAEVVRRDVGSGRETVLFRGGASIGPLALSADERSLAFATFPRERSRAELYVASVAGGEPRLVQTRPANSVYLSVSWSRDGRFLVYTCAPDPPDRGELRRLRLSDGDDRLLTTASGGYLNEIRPHPDGRRFAFTAGEWRQEIWALERVAETVR